MGGSQCLDGHRQGGEEGGEEDQTQGRGRLQRRGGAPVSSQPGGDMVVQGHREEEGGPGHAGTVSLASGETMIVSNLVEVIC